jgi:hypothetical protein
MQELIERYGPMVVAALESLRATVYPSYHLRDFSQLSIIDSSEVGWAIGIPREDSEEGAEFVPYLFVKLDLDEQDRPVRFVCWDRHGREVETPRGDLSRESLIEALQRLHQKQPGPARQIWRWLGRKWRSTRGKKS